MLSSSTTTTHARVKVALPRPQSGAATAPSSSPSPALPTSSSSSSLSSSSETTASARSSNSTSSTTSSRRFSGVQAKVGSLDQIHYKPTPSQVKVLTYKQDLSKVQSKVGSLEQIDYKPAPSQVKVLTHKHQDLSRVQSKVGSMDRIDYKPRPSQVQIVTYKQDLSHVQSKVDARLALPSPPASAGGDEDQDEMPWAEGRPSTGTSATTSSTATNTGNRRGSVQRSPTGTSTMTTTATTTMAPRTRARQASAPVISISTRATAVQPTPGTPGPRRSSASAASPSAPSTTATRRQSKHILPTQRLSFDHVKSKVDSLGNLQYNRERARPVSRGSFSSLDGRAFSPSSTISPASSTASSKNNSRRSSLSGGGGGTGAGTGSATGMVTPTSPVKRVPSFKIPDYSKVKPKVGSLENAGHQPLGGNVRVFHERLTFRENAQSKISREINIASFYQDTEDSILEQEENDETQQQEHGAEDQDSPGPTLNSTLHPAPAAAAPKALLAALEELAEELEGAQLGNDTQPMADPPTIH